MSALALGVGDRSPDAAPRRRQLLGQRRAQLVSVDAIDRRASLSAAAQDDGVVPVWLQAPPHALRDDGERRHVGRRARSRLDGGRFSPRAFRFALTARVAFARAFFSFFFVRRITALFTCLRTRTRRAALCSRCATSSIRSPGQGGHAVCCIRAVLLLIGRRSTIDDDDRRTAGTSRRCLPAVSSSNARPSWTACFSPIAIAASTASSTRNALRCFGRARARARASVRPVAERSVGSHSFSPSRSGVRRPSSRSTMAPRGRRFRSPRAIRVSGGVSARLIADLGRRSVSARPRVLFASAPERRGTRLSSLCLLLLFVCVCLFLFVLLCAQRP